MENIVRIIRQDLKNMADPKIKEGGKRFFKEDIKLYGIRTADVNKLAKLYFREIKSQGKDEIFDLCESLWRSGYMEESFIACQWVYALRRQYSEKDFSRFEKWIKNYVNNWASCDGFCNHSMGAFIEMYPNYIQRLKKWTKSKNRWARRAAAVSLILPAKKGLFLDDVFEIAGMLLVDEDDLVQKGYGWLLKVASRVHLTEVFDYIMEYKETMPRTALRYAIEKMPLNFKALAMA